MSNQARSNVDEQDDTTNDSESLIPTLLVAGSALVLGYFAGRASYQLGYDAGRVSYQRDIEEALRRIKESPDPLEITVRAL
jgi:hypothetical protein